VGRNDARPADHRELTDRQGCSATLLPRIAAQSVKLSTASMESEAFSWGVMHWCNIVRPAFVLTTDVLIAEIGFR
jgi:hypothetical protein